MPLYLGDGTTMTFNINTIDANTAGDVVFAGYDEKKASLLTRVSSGPYVVPFIGLFDGGAGAVSWMKYVQVLVYDPILNYDMTSFLVDQIKFYSNSQKIIAFLTTHNAIMRLDRSGNILDCFYFLENSAYDKKTIASLNSLAVDNSGNFAITSGGVNWGSLTGSDFGFPSRFLCFNSNGNVYQYSYFSSSSITNYFNYPPVIYDPISNSYYIGINPRYQSGDNWIAYGVERFDVNTCTIQDSLHIQLANMPNHFSTDGIIGVDQDVATLDVYQNLVGLCFHQKFNLNDLYNDVVTVDQSAGYPGIFFANTVTRQYVARTLGYYQYSILKCQANVVYEKSPGVVQMNFILSSITDPNGASYFYQKTFLGVLLYAFDALNQPGVTIYSLKNEPETRSLPYYGYYSSQAVFTDRNNPGTFYFAGSQLGGNTYVTGLLNYFDVNQICNPASFQEGLDIGYLPFSKPTSLTSFSIYSTITPSSIPISYNSLLYAEAPLVQPTVKVANGCSQPVDLHLTRTNAVSSTSIQCPVACPCIIDTIQFSTTPVSCSDAQYSYYYKNNGIIVDTNVIAIKNATTSSGMSTFTLTPSLSDVSTVYSLEIFATLVQASLLYISPFFSVTVTSTSIISPLSGMVPLNAYLGCPFNYTFGQYSSSPVCNNVIPITYTLTVNGNTNTAPITMASDNNFVSIATTPTIANVGQVYNGVILAQLTALSFIQNANVAFSLTVQTLTLVSPSSPVSPITISPYCPTSLTVGTYVLTPICSGLTYELSFNGTLSSAFNASLIPAIISSTAGSVTLTFNPPLELMYSTTTVVLHVTTAFPSIYSDSYTFELVVGVLSGTQFTAPISPFIPDHYYPLYPQESYSVPVGFYSITPSCLMNHLKYELVFNGVVMDDSNYNQFQANISLGVFGVEVSISTPWVFYSEYYNVSLRASVVGIPAIYDDSFKMKMEFKTYCELLTFIYVPVIDTQVYILGQTPLEITYDDFITDPPECETQLDYFISVDFTTKQVPYLSQSTGAANLISISTSNPQYLGLHYLVVVSSSIDLERYNYTGFFLQITDSALNANKTTIRYSFPQLQTQYYNNATYALNYFDSIISLSDLDSIQLVPPVPAFISYKDGQLSFNLSNISSQSVTFTVNVQYKGISQNFNLSFFIMDPPIVSAENTTDNQTVNVTNLVLIPSMINTTKSDDSQPFLLTASIDSISVKGMMKLKFKYLLQKVSGGNWINDDVLIQYQKYGEDDKVTVNYSVSTYSGNYLDIQLYFVNPKSISISQVTLYTITLRSRTLSMLPF